MEGDNLITHKVYSAEKEDEYKTGTYVCGGTVTAGQTSDLETKSEETLPIYISTTAMEKTTGNHSAIVKENAKIRDKISYHIPLTGDYYFEAEYYDVTADEILGTVTSRKNKIHVDASDESDWDGTYTMPSFTVDGTALKGHTVYVNEKLHRVYTDEKTGETKDEVLIDHDSVAVTDNDQAVWFPDGGTNAFDETTNTKKGTISETETVYDDVTCSNFISGYEYTVKGSLYYAEDATLKDGTTVSKKDKFPEDKFSLVGATILKNGEEIDADVTVDKENNTVTFIALENSDSENPGTDFVVRMKYEVNSKGLEGAKVVFFEDILNNGVSIISHNDIEDKNETIYYPKLKETTKVSPANETKDTNDTEKPAKTAANVKTGDTGNVFWLWVVIICAAILAARYVIYFTRQR